ncbi:hypothetical protein ACFW96_25785, partial [Streptomyces gardneri]
LFWGGPVVGPGPPADPPPRGAGGGGPAPAAARTPPSATRPAPAPAHEPETTHEPVHDGAPAVSGAEETPDGIVLPRRRRGQTLAAQLKAGEAPAEPRQEAPRTGPAAAAPPRFGSFHRAVRGAGGRAADERPADTSVPSDPQDPAAAPHPSASSNSPYSEGNPR